MKRGECKCCGRVTFIQNKTKQWCSECVYKSNHDGKTRQQVAQERMRRKSCMKKRKETGEKAMFERIWRERPHVCVNCGKRLGNVPYAWMFSHRIAKGANASLRLDPANVDLLCFDCHFARDFQGEHVYEKRRLNHDER